MTATNFLVPPPELAQTAEMITGAAEGRRRQHPQPRGPAMNITDAIGIIESIAGVTDELTPVGEAWDVILKYIYNPANALPTPEATND